MSTVLNAGTFDSWCEGLADDPSVSREDGALPTLAQLLSREENMEINRRARAHLVLPPEHDPTTLRQLWRLRMEGTTEEYLAALQAENLESYLDELNWDNIGPCINV